MTAPGGVFSATVEVDETFIGGRTPRVGRYGYKRKSDGKSPHATYDGKTAGMALVNAADARRHSR